MSERVFKPKERVPAPGIYRVIHYRHRLPHEVMIADTEVFPACLKCGNKVGFILLQSAEKLRQDNDFANPPFAVND